MLGASLFYGDSIITPAMSVLSALEGLAVAAPSLEGRSMPIALGVLIALFLIQRWGTGFVGRFFGPITLLYFVTLAITGIQQIVQDPSIFQALNPARAAAFLNDQRLGGSLLAALGGIVLSVTGAEALYADMGHFGPGAIRIAWLFVVLPCLTCNYLGQGAMLLRDAGKADNPFFHLFPPEAAVPAVVLATLATVIASQAVISGAYSMTSQAMKLGLLPRMTIRHMSSSKQGQIYIPAVNFIRATPLSSYLLISLSLTLLSCCEPTLPHLFSPSENHVFFRSQQ
jgi:KUP system potassium uptake protein